MANARQQLHYSLILARWIIIMKQIQYTRTKTEVLYATALSSIVSTVLTNPIEVAKLNLQYFPLFCPKYPHQSYRQLITCSCSKFSIAGSIKSLKIAVPQVLFSSIIFMQLYEQSRQYFINEWSVNSISATMMASFSARLVVTSVNIPFETLRIKLSNRIESNKLGDSYLGFKVMLARDMVYSLMFWSMVQTYRNHLASGEYRTKMQKDQTFSIRNFTMNMLPGFIFGGIVSAITTPFDTLKTRVQTQGIKNYKIWGGISQIYLKEGLTGLFSGIEWRVLKNGLHSSLYLLFYEYFLSKISARDLMMIEMQEEM